MTAYTYRIADEIFQRFPGYVRGVVIAHELANGPSPPALIELLREAEAAVRARVKSEAVAEEPRIKSWRKPKWSRPVLKSWNWCSAFAAAARASRCSLRTSLRFPWRLEARARWCDRLVYAA